MALIMYKITVRKYNISERMEYSSVLRYLVDGIIFLRVSEARNTQAQFGFQSLVVTFYTTSFAIQVLALPTQCIHAFCTDLRKKHQIFLCTALTDGFL
jgi:hypothetical protein